jgi:hypothetical protein
LIENNTTLKLPNDIIVDYAKLFTFLANYKFQVKDGFYVAGLMGQKLGRRTSGGGKTRRGRTRRGRTRRG